MQRRPKTWRGRTVYYSERYPRVFWPEHPMAKADGMIRIHRAVAAEAEGRLLLPSEHVHHMDEDPLNWRRINLKVMSSSSHSSHHKSKSPPKLKCSNCFLPFSVSYGQANARIKQNVDGRIYCGQACAHKASERIEWPTKEELYDLVSKFPITRISEKLGVSDRAVAKRCVKLKISTRTRGRGIRSAGIVQW